MTTPTYTYTLGLWHVNDLGAEGLPCDGTVSVSQSDAVCFADVKYTINGTDYEQKIMNVPYTDATRTALYLDYFVNDQAAQLGG